MEPKQYQCYGGPMDGALVAADQISKSGEFVSGIRYCSGVVARGGLSTDLYVSEFSDFLPIKRVSYKLDKAKRLTYVGVAK